VTDNIVGGAFYGGIIARGHDCGDYSDQSFKNNVAHSVDGVGGGVYPDPFNPSHKKCYEGSYFSSYKNQMNGIWGFFSTEGFTLSHITSIDNVKGIAAMI